jgi:hypothetical protein
MVVAMPPTRGRPSVKFTCPREVVEDMRGLVEALRWEDEGSERKALGGYEDASMSRFVELAVRHELLRWRDLRPDLFKAKRG